MAQQILNVGTTANDGTGEGLRSGMVKVNANFADHEARIGTLEGPTFTQAGTGAVARTTQAKLRDGVSVKDFAAVTGDGATDDAAALNLALTRIAPSAGGTGMAFVPPGTYMLSTSVVVPSGVTLTAIRGTVVFKATSGNAANPALLTVSTVSNVLVQGIIFDGSASTITAVNNTLTVFSATNVAFDSITLQNMRGLALIFSTACVNCGIRNSTISNIGNYYKTSGLAADRRQGVVFSSGSGNKGNFATGNYFTDIGLDALQFSNQSDFVASNNRFVALGTSYLTTAFADYPAAIYANTNTGGTISANVIDTPHGNGIDTLNNTDLVITGNRVTAAGGTGIGVFSNSNNVSISGNVVTNSGQAVATIPGTVWKAGITVDGATGATSSKITVLGNVCADTQSTKTQPWGFHVKTGNKAFISNLWVSPDNDFTGNLTADLGGDATIGGFSHFRIQAVGISAHMPDGTATGGNARGQYAVDLQQFRGSASQVASGLGAFVVGGNNTASSNFSAAWGLGCTANGLYSTAYGHDAQARSRTKAVVYCGGGITSPGDNQRVFQPLKRTTTDATATRLTADMATPSSLNTANIPNNSTARFSIEVIARQTGGTAGTAGDTAIWSAAGILTVGASAATAALLAAVTPSKEAASAGAAAWSVAVTADAGFGGVAITVTGEANKNISWAAMVTMWELVA